MLKDYNSKYWQVLNTVCYIYKQHNVPPNISLPKTGKHKIPMREIFIQALK